MKRALLLLLVGMAVARNGAAADSAAELMTQAKAAVVAKRFDDALRLYERVFVENPRVTTSWFAAQRGLALTLAQKGDFVGAAQAAHICVDAALDSRTYTDALDLTARILSAADKDVIRANLFLEFQRTGPTNGAVNPLDAIGYPALPDRDRVLAAARAESGDTVAAASYRALTFRYSGKPRDALAQYADAFRRSSKTFRKGSELVGPAVDLVQFGLRAARGHAVDLDTAQLFVIWGPNGPDGQPHTADDLPDPFSGLLPAPPAPDQGGLSGLSTNDLAAVRHVRDAAQILVADPLLPLKVRDPAVRALQRANEALDGWGTPGQLEWYRRRLFNSAIQPLIGDPASELVALTLLDEAVAAARDRSLHLGGMRAFWNEVEARCAALRIDKAHTLVVARERNSQITNALSRARFALVVPVPLKKPATF
jgi:hypothetical protein